MNKKINLSILFLAILVISSSTVFAKFTFYGDVSVDGNNTPTGDAIDVYVEHSDGSLVRDNAAKTYVGDVNSGLPQRYWIAFEGTIGRSVYFQVCGNNVTQGEKTLTSADTGSGRNLDLTANKSANSAACTYSCGCTGGYCCSGATEYTDGSGDGTCQASACAAAAEEPAASTGGGGGGGGGGGAAITTATSQTINTGRINTGQTASAVFTSAGLGVTNVQITVKKTVTASSVTVVNQGSITGIATRATTDAEDSANLKAYAYLKITAGKIANTNIERAVIKFKVKKTEGYDPTTIELRRYDAVYKTWTPLPTKYTAKDKDYDYFEAETPGFSIFAIVGNRVAITMMELLDMVRAFYTGTSPYTMMDILDQIRVFYGG